MAFFQKTKQVIIDPRSSFNYGSFYFQGLENLFGKSRISFSQKPFKHLQTGLGNNLRFIVKENGTEKKVYIHTDDSYKIHADMYEWCDVYGCVNANYNAYPKKQFPKLVSLVPSFGIRKYSLIKTIWQAFIIFLKVPNDIIKRKAYNKYTQKEECNKFKNIKRHFGYFIKNYLHRCPYSAYKNELPTSKNYIFFLSTLWYNDVYNKNDEGVNMRRANFIRACKKIKNVEFEGGLLANDTSSNELFFDVLTTERIAMPDWIEKTKKSTLVFNTPAFWDCHGWKLGEYLALGKCIVSTALSNDLPYPLEHGVNIHFVENDEIAMREAIEFIYANPDYRQKLEQGAKEYWQKYGTPEASLKLLNL